MSAGKGYRIPRPFAAFTRSALFLAPFLWSLWLPRNAIAANSPLFFGSTDPGTISGPVLSNPQIVPIFWGDFTSNGMDYVTMFYLQGFANYLAGAETPDPSVASNSTHNMVEPIMRQYGIWGASILNAHYFSNTPVANQEADAVNAIHNWQHQGLLPPDGTNTIFLIVMNGFSSYPWQTSQKCAEHKVSGSTVYAMASFDGCVQQDAAQFERIISHELEEAMTDPYMLAGEFGWVTHTGPLGFGQNEGADQCEIAVDPPIPYGSLSFGDLQNFTDNSTSENYVMLPGDGSASGAHCGTWSGSRAPHFTAAYGQHDLVDVFYRNFSDGGALEHASLYQSRVWFNEIVERDPGTIVGAPAVAGAGPYHVFARLLGDGSIGGGIAHWLVNEGGGAPRFVGFLPPGPNGDGIGPVTAVTTSPGTLDVFSSDIDGSLLHFKAGTNGVFTTENLAGLLLGPPTAVSRGTNMVDVLSYGSADLQSFSWNSPGHPNKWSWADRNITDIYFSYPVDVISAVPFYSAKPSTNAFDSLAVYVSGLFLNFGTASDSWSRSIKLSFDRFDTTNHGTVGLATRGTKVNAVWWQGPGAGFTAQRFVTGTPSPVVTVNGAGCCMSPPQVNIPFSYPDTPEIVAMGNDGCLQEAYISYVGAGAPVVHGMTRTTICGLR